MNLKRSTVTGETTRQSPTLGTTKRRPSRYAPNLSEPTALPKVCPHRFRELLDGDPAFTKGGVASEALNGHRNRHGSALPWKVSQPAIVSAVDAV